MIAHGSAILGACITARPRPAGQRLFGRHTVLDQIEDFNGRSDPRTRSHTAKPTLITRRKYLNLHSAIVGRLTGDLYVMHMAFLEARTRDLDEVAVLAHLINRRTACISHCRPQAAHQLVNDRAC